MKTYRMPVHRTFIVACLCALACCALSAAAESAAPIVKFSPIPVLSIFRPLQPHGSADDALASGRVVRGAYPMAARAGRRWRIAFLFPHLKDPYWTGCGYGVISEARRLGIAVDILPASGYDDLAGQQRLMDRAIAGRYDAIVISPIDMTANNAAIAKARAAGIPVFEMANDSRSDDLNIKVTTSLQGMGLEATRWLVRDARRRGLTSVNIALLPGPLGAGWVKGEVDGTRIAAAEAPIAVNVLDIRYGDSDRAVQSELAAQLLVRHGRRLDYILACTGCAPAAVNPIREAGLGGRVRVVAYDLTGEIAQLIRSKAIEAAVDTKGVSQARVTLNAAVNLLEGRSRQLPHTILIQLGMVDQRNIRDYPLDTSIAPDGYHLALSYVPGRE